MTDLTTAETRAVRIRISGRVQGVWYRGWTVREATRLGLDGWVRNRSDGDVEAVFHGPVETVDDMIGKCWKGPQGARVETIDVVDVSEVPKSGFRQAPTV